MEERRVEEESDDEERDVILVSEGECVCERERVCVLTLDRFFFHRI